MKTGKAWSSVTHVLNQSLRGLAVFYLRTAVGEPLGDVSLLQSAAFAWFSRHADQASQLAILPRSLLGDSGQTSTALDTRLFLDSEDILDSSGELDTSRDTFSNTAFIEAINQTVSSRHGLTPQPPKPKSKPRELAE
jgi:hypothetical protein